ncbi:MAG TPA: hypothetical protein VGD55_03825 [Acidothermaceae bacterium]
MSPLWSNADPEPIGTGAKLDTLIAGGRWIVLEQAVAATTIRPAAIDNLNDISRLL